MKDVRSNRNFIRHGQTHWTWLSVQIGGCLRWSNTLSIQDVEDFELLVRFSSRSSRTNRVWDGGVGFCRLILSPSSARVRHTCNMLFMLVVVNNIAGLMICRTTNPHSWEIPLELILAYRSHHNASTSNLAAMTGFDSCDQTLSVICQYWLAA